MAPGNPLWLDWLRDFQQEAEGNESHAAQAFKKAARSLTKCPITMKHPSEALQLENIGRVTVDKLIARLKEHCAKTNEPFPDRLPEDTSSKAAQKKALLDHQQAANEFDFGSDEEGAALFASTAKKGRGGGRGGRGRGRGGGPARGAPRAKAAPKSRISAAAKGKGKELAVFEDDEGQRERDRPDHRGTEESGHRLSAKQLAADAAMKRHFLASDEQRERDRSTAWHSKDVEDAASERLNALSSSGSKRDRDLIAKTAATGEYARQGVFGTENRIQAVDMDHKPFEYFYLDEHDNRTHQRASAECSQEDVTSHPLYRIEFRAAQMLHSMATKLVKISSLDRAIPIPGPITRAAFIRERVSNDPCPGFIQEVPKQKEKEKEMSAMERLMGNIKAKDSRDRSAMYAAPATVQRLGAGTSSTMEILAKSSSMSTTEMMEVAMNAVASGSGSGSGSAGASGFRPAGIASTHGRTQSAPSHIHKRGRDTNDEGNRDEDDMRPCSSQPLPYPHINRLPPLLPHQHPYSPLPSKSSLSSSALAAVAVNTASTFAAGSFDIILLIDSREVGSRTDRDAFVRLLEKEGVRAEKRMLPIGDMLWIARRKPDYLAAGGSEGNEVVLDAVIERKRLDDLATSITDGRYLDQKKRMIDSGLKHKIYLVEEYDVRGQFDQWGKQIWTAKSQLQVNDGFYCRETSSLRDTVEYLIMRTKIMKDIFESTDLHILPSASIVRATYLSLQTHLRTMYPSRTYLTSFSAFEGLTKGSGVRSVRAQWAQMIQCVKGMSAEKAVALVSRWETPRSLYEDVQQHRREDAREQSELDDGKPKPKKKVKVEEFIARELETGMTRDVKGALSTKIYNLFSKKVYTE